MPGLGSHHLRHRRVLCISCACTALWHDQRRQLQLQDLLRRRKVDLQSRTHGGAMQKYVRESFFRVYSWGNQVVPKARFAGGAATARCCFGGCSRSNCGFGKSAASQIRQDTMRDRTGRWLRSVLQADNDARHRARCHGPLRRLPRVRRAPHRRSATGGSALRKTGRPAALYWERRARSLAPVMPPTGPAFVDRFHEAL